MSSFSGRLCPFSVHSSYVENGERKTKNAKRKKFTSHVFGFSFIHDFNNDTFTLGYASAVHCRVFLVCFLLLGFGCFVRLRTHGILGRGPGCCFCLVSQIGCRGPWHGACIPFLYGSPKLWACFWTYGCCDELFLVQRLASGVISGLGYEWTSRFIQIYTSCVVYVCGHRRIPLHCACPGSCGWRQQPRARPCRASQHRMRARTLAGRQHGCTAASASAIWTRLASLAQTQGERSDDEETRQETMLDCTCHLPQPRF